MKNREKTFYILGAIILLTVLFFGFDTKPSTQKALEKSRVLNSQKFDLHALQAQSKEGLNEDEIRYLETLESQARFPGPDSAKTKILKELSGYWFQLRKPILAGVYAESVAEIEQTAASWSIAGTTFAAALTDASITEEDRLKARDQAVAAFENAISLEPQVIEHRVNQALCFIETPDTAQPMKGVQMLASLASTYPDSPLPPYHLARLAVRTGQMERAAERIGQALALDSTNTRIACLAVDIYTAVNKPAEAEKHKQYCITN